MLEQIKELIHLPWQERLTALTDIANGQRVTFSTSLGMEDQLITHLIAENTLPIDIFTLDTGRLFKETYDTFQATRDAYGDIQIKTYFPEAASVETFVNSQGINGFYDSVENRKACCHIRKVEPLNRALEGAKIWVSGLRHEHSDNRDQLPIAELDAARGIVKFYPLLDMDEATLRNAIEKHGVPYNPLHDEGFPSIGCAPCTRAVEAGEHMRAGRWWWESEGNQECGLHFVDGKLVRAKNANA